MVGLFDPRLRGEFIRRHIRMENEAVLELGPETSDTWSEMEDLAKVRREGKAVEAKKAKRERAEMARQVKAFRKEGERTPYLKSFHGRVAVPVAHTKYSLAARGGSATVRPGQNPIAKARKDVLKALDGEPASPTKTSRLPYRNKENMKMPARVSYLYELGRVEQQRLRHTKSKEAPRVATANIQPQEERGVQGQLLGWQGSNYCAEKASLQLCAASGWRLRPLLTLELRPYIDGASMEAIRFGPFVLLEDEYEIRLIVRCEDTAKVLRGSIKVPANSISISLQDPMATPWKWYPLDDGASSLKLALQSVCIQPLEHIEKSRLVPEQKEIMSPLSDIWRLTLTDCVGSSVLTNVSLLQGGGITRKAFDAVDNLETGISVLCAASDATAVFEIKVRDMLDEKRHTLGTCRIPLRQECERILRLGNRRELKLRIDNLRANYISGWLSVVFDVPSPSTNHGDQQFKIKPPQRLWAVLLSDSNYLYLYRSRQAPLTPVHVCSLHGAQFNRVALQRRGSGDSSTAWLIIIDDKANPKDKPPCYAPKSTLRPKSTVLLDRATDLRKEGHAWRHWDKHFLSEEEAHAGKRRVASASSSDVYES